MNIHISQYTQFQDWNKRTIFDEYPLHIRSGKLTVTLLFHDKESVQNLKFKLENLLWEMEDLQVQEIPSEFDL